MFIYHHHLAHGLAHSKCSKNAVEWIVMCFPETDGFNFYLRGNTHFFKEMQKHGTELIHQSTDNNYNNH